jgi:hypothetical protein
MAGGGGARIHHHDVVAIDSIHQVVTFNRVRPLSFFLWFFEWWMGTMDKY